MLPRVRLLPIAFLLVAACSAPPAVRPELASWVASTPIAFALPPGSLVALQPVRGPLPKDWPAAAIEGLWRESLRQSPTIDFAHGPVATGANTAQQLQLSYDATARTFTATLSNQGNAVHLAGVRIVNTPGAALDELAARTRTALGERELQDLTPIEMGYSKDLSVVAACEAALVQLQDGGFAAATRMLTAARPRDGGCTMLLDAMATAAVLRGQTREAVALATEALALRQRLMPATQHRLARTLLLARASISTATARRCDEDLLQLSTVAQRERPADPDPRVSGAIALNFLGRFAEARTALTPLAPRLPRSFSVRYHLGWAELGCGEANVAAQHFAAVAAVLPPSALLVPRALARFEAGDHDGLRTWLQEIAQDRAFAETEALHEVRRMQAALELLTGHRDSAAAWMLRDLAGARVEAGEVLVRLGQGERLRPMLATLQALKPDPAIADAVAYVSGLIEIRATTRSLPELSENMRNRGVGVWGDLLDAYGSEVQGKLAAERSALAQAAKASSSPLVKAALQRNLRRSGNTLEADALRTAMQREMKVIDLRRRSQHPLLGPELAFAWIAD
jgi:hypothetical protein